MDNHMEENKRAVAQSRAEGANSNAELAAELRDLLDAAEAIHMVLQERWGDTNGATVDAKAIVEYFKKTVAANV